MELCVSSSDCQDFKSSQFPGTKHNSVLAGVGSMNASAQFVESIVLSCFVIKSMVRVMSSSIMVRRGR